MCVSSLCVASGCALRVFVRWCLLYFLLQLASNRMGVLMASLAVTMLLAVALSGSDEGSGLAIKSAKLSQAKAVPAMSLHKMEQVAMLPSS